MTINRFLRRGFLTLAVTALMTSCEELPTPPRAADHYSLKATVLYNLSQFTDWPADAFAGPRGPLVIGILGTDPFGTFLEDAVRGQKVNVRPLRLQHLRRVEDVINCQILFIGASETKRLPRILNTLKGLPILTVSDLPEFASRGGMIGLLTDGDRVELQINFEVLTAARLTMSAKLLRTAEIVSTTMK